MTHAKAGDLKTKYWVADHLGTPRAITYAADIVVSRHDYWPVEELFAGIGGRTTVLGYIK